MEIVQVLEAQGTQEFSLAATHGLFTGTSVERLNALDKVSEIVVTDTVYAPEASEQIKKLNCLSVASVFGDGILCNHEGKSVGELFTFWSEDMLPDSSLG